MSTDAPYVPLDMDDASPARAARRGTAEPNTDGTPGKRHRSESKDIGQYEDLSDSDLDVTAPKRAKRQRSWLLSDSNEVEKRGPGGSEVHDAAHIYGTSEAPIDVTSGSSDVEATLPPIAAPSSARRITRPTATLSSGISQSDDVPMSNGPEGIRKRNRDREQASQDNPGRGINEESNEGRKREIKQPKLGTRMESNADAATSSGRDQDDDRPSVSDEELMSGGTPTSEEYSDEDDDDDRSRNQKGKLTQRQIDTSICDIVVEQTLADLPPSAKVALHHGRMHVPPRSLNTDSISKSVKRLVLDELHAFHYLLQAYLKLAEKDGS